MSADVRRDLGLALAAAAVLVFLRAAVFIIYDQSFFDSDQAIVGLMAKHLIEGRAFPLYYYGQTYMLGVDAWLAAPILAIFGPTVAALHLALTLGNVAAAWLIIVGLCRWGDVPPMAALLSSTFFVFAPPLTGASLIEAGANIGPFLYVAALWMLRRRPFWFGAVLGLGFLHREFTVYGAVTVVVADLFTGRLLRQDRIRFWLLALVATLGAWQSIQALRPYADIMGPGTAGQFIPGAGSQLGNIADRVSVDWTDLPLRWHALLGEQIPRLLNLRPTTDPIGPQGHGWLFWPFVLIGLAMATRGLSVVWCARGTARVGFELHLAGVGALAALAALLTRPAGTVADRYVLLTLLLPIGVAGLYFAAEPRRWLRQGAVAMLLIWNGASAGDHMRQVTRYAGGREPNETRDLVTGLLARGIHVADAGYWRAYKVSYLSGEAVKVASTDVIRITEYQELAARAGAGLVHIQETPCENGEAVSVWYLCRR
jgi:hypothetical protein